jgi:guanyl-specific ribonuclease Sa
MRLHRGLPLLAAVVIAVVVSACGSSSSSPRSTGSSSSNTTSTGSASSSPTSTGSSSASASSDGTPVDSPAMRSELEQELRGTAGVKPPEAKKIVDCIIAKLSAAGITTDGEAASHEGKLESFSEACAEKVVAAGG